MQSFQNDCCRPSTKKFSFFQSKSTDLEAIVTTMNEVNNDKTKVQDEFVFCSVSLVYFTAELDLTN